MIICCLGVGVEFSCWMHRFSCSVALETGVCAMEELVGFQLEGRLFCWDFTPVCWGFRSGHCTPEQWWMWRMFPHYLINHLGWLCYSFILFLFPFLELIFQGLSRVTFIIKEIIFSRFSNHNVYFVQVVENVWTKRSCTWSIRQY